MPPPLGRPLSSAFGIGPRRRTVASYDYVHEAGTIACSTDTSSDAAFFSQSAIACPNPCWSRKTCFRLFKGTDDYEVVVDFDSWGADLIRGWKWHASQEITELPRRQLRLRLRLNSIEEAERWVLSWGQHATVVRPQALANRLRDTGQALQSRYQP
jgi:hypothetical protein